MVVGFAERPRAGDGGSSVDLSYSSTLGTRLRLRL
jgi:hypothetical protein